jgi:hypothetical protein
LERAAELQEWEQSKRKDREVDREEDRDRGRAVDGDEDSAEGKNEGRDGEGVRSKTRTSTGTRTGLGTGTGSSADGECLTVSSRGFLVVTRSPFFKNQRIWFLAITTSPWYALTALSLKACLPFLNGSLKHTP